MRPDRRAGATSWVVGRCACFQDLEDFGGEEVVVGFAAADEAGGGAVDEDFGGAGAGVVVRGEAHAVGSGVEDGDEVAGFDGGEGAVAGEEVAGFADRADDVDRCRVASVLAA